VKQVHANDVERPNQPGRSTGERPSLATTRLWLFGGLGEEERTALEAACSDVRAIEGKQDLVKERASTGVVHLLLEGWACRYKLTGNGSRQIPTLLLPGDICDIDAILFDRLDYGVATLTPCRVAVLPRARVLELSARYPRIGAALWWLTMVENSTLTEWVLCLGRRSADQHLAHLFCELLVRLAAVGMAENNGYALPLTQEQLADALGLTSVHVNRTLQQLRKAGLVELDRGRLRILEWEAIKRRAGFDPAYLRPEGLRRSPMAA